MLACFEIGVATEPLQTRRNGRCLRRSGLELGDRAVDLGLEVAGDRLVIEHLDHPGVLDGEVRDEQRVGVEDHRIAQEMTVLVSALEAGRTDGALNDGAGDFVHLARHVGVFDGFSNVERTLFSADEEAEEAQVFKDVALVELDGRLTVDLMDRGGGSVQAEQAALIGEVINIQFFVDPVGVLDADQRYGLIKRKGAPVNLRALRGGAVFPVDGVDLIEEARQLVTRYSVPVIIFIHRRETLPFWSRGVKPPYFDRK